MKMKVKLSLYWILRRGPAEGVAVYLHIFLTFTLVLVSGYWTVLPLGRFIARKMNW
jgi:hypothetical protein